MPPSLIEAFHQPTATVHVVMPAFIGLYQLASTSTLSSQKLPIQLLLPLNSRLLHLAWQEVDS